MLGLAVEFFNEFLLYLWSGPVDVLAKNPSKYRRKLRWSYQSLRGFGENILIGKYVPIYGDFLISLLFLSSGTN